MIENVEQQKKNEEVVSLAISIFKVSQDWYFGKHTIELTSLAQSPNSRIKDEKGGEFQGRVVLEFRVERLEGESVSRCNVMDGWSPELKTSIKGNCKQYHITNLLCIMIELDVLCFDISWNPVIDSNTNVS